MAERLISGDAQADDLDLSLRPRRLADFVGKPRLKDQHRLIFWVSLEEKSPEGFPTPAGEVVAFQR